MQHFELGPASAIDYDCSMGFEVEGHSIFVVNKDGNYFAYLNRCPHLGVELNWNEHVFLDVEKVFVQCSTHGALFNIDNGLCVAGPCLGQSLQRIALSNDNGVLSVEL